MKTRSRPSPDWRALGRPVLIFLGSFALLFVLFGLFAGITTLGAILFFAALSAAAAVAFGARIRREFDVMQNPDAVIRRAVFRGLVRTALSALLVLFVGFWLLHIAASLWQGRDDREARFARVIGTGFAVAHPDYQQSPPFCCNTGITGMDMVLTVSPRIPGSFVSDSNEHLRINLLGHIEQGSVPVLPYGPINSALNEPPQSPRQTRALLNGLPHSITALAIVQLRKPLAMRPFVRLLRRQGYRVPPAGLDMPPVFLEPPDARPPGALARSLTWPEPLSTDYSFFRSDDAPTGAFVPRLREVDSLAQFQAWAKELRPSDDANLEAIGLPSAKEIKAVAADAEVHGFIAQNVSPTQIRRLLDDRQVATVTPAHVDFDLKPGGYTGSNLG
jgi:hypothetical protein